jgi:hypothetical protein
LIKPIEDNATAESCGGATAKAKRKQIEKLPSPKRD